MPPRATIGLTQRKHYLSLADGHAIDLSSIDPNANVSAAVIAALKERIVQLEDELATYTEGAPPPAKRARKTPAAAPPPQVAAAPKAGGSTSAPAPVAGPAAVKAEEKKLKVHLKKIFDRLKKECKSADVKFQGSTKTIRFEEVLSVEEFNALFVPGQLGILIQPRPENKPNSTVTIIEFYSSDAIRGLFGSEFKDLKGNRWTRGGGPGFVKSVKLGLVDVEPRHLQVSYSKNGMKLSLKFEVDMVGVEDDDCYYARANYGYAF